MSPTEVDATPTFLLKHCFQFILLLFLIISQSLIVLSSLLHLNLIVLLTTLYHVLLFLKLWKNLLGLSTCALDPPGDCCGRTELKADYAAVLKWEDEKREQKSVHCFKGLLVSASLFLKDFLSSQTNGRYSGEGGRMCPLGLALPWNLFLYLWIIITLKSLGVSVGGLLFKQNTSTLHTDVMRT